jgi:hypothetical protein
MKEDKKIVNPDANPDPITGEAGAHPVGTGVGAAGVGVAATAIGAAVGGPVGAVVGAVVGSVAGGLAGKNVAEKINPTVEDEYWRTNYSSRPYAESTHQYDDYSPAYRTGYEGYSTYGSEGMSYNAAEPKLRQDYERQSNDGSSNTGRLAWEKAKHATKDAWDRVERAIPGDADHDGK